MRGIRKGYLIDVVQAEPLTTPQSQSFGPLPGVCLPVHLCQKHHVGSIGQPLSHCLISFLLLLIFTNLEHSRSLSLKQEPCSLSLRFLFTACYLSLACHVLPLPRILFCLTGKALLYSSFMKEEENVQRRRRRIVVLGTGSPYGHRFCLLLQWSPSLCPGALLLPWTLLSPSTLHLKGKAGG
jgi:hypothetical protein